jgi:hypothetical protein
MLLYFYYNEIIMSASSFDGFTSAGASFTAFPQQSFITPASSGKLFFPGIVSRLPPPKLVKKRSTTEEFRIDDFPTNDSVSCDPAATHLLFPSLTADPSIARSFQLRMRHRLKERSESLDFPNFDSAGISRIFNKEKQEELKNEFVFLPISADTSALQK